MLLYCKLFSTLESRRTCRWPEFLTAPEDEFLNELNPHQARNRAEVCYSTRIFAQQANRRTAAHLYPESRIPRLHGVTQINFIAGSARCVRLRDPRGWHARKKYCSLLTLDSQQLEKIAETRFILSLVNKCVTETKLDNYLLWIINVWRNYINLTSCFRLVRQSAT